MNCQECRSLADEAFDEGLAPADQKTVALHLSRCADCQGYYARRRAEHIFYFQALNRRRAADLPPGFEARVAAAVLAAPAPMRRLPFRLPRWTALAASLLAMAGAAYAAWRLGAWVEEAPAPATEEAPAAPARAEPDLIPVQEEEPMQTVVKTAAAALLAVSTSAADGAASATSNTLALDDAVNAAAWSGGHSVDTRIPLAATSAAAAYNTSAALGTVMIIR